MLFEKHPCYQSIRTLHLRNGFKKKKLLQLYMPLGKSSDPKLLTIPQGHTSPNLGDCNSRAERKKKKKKTFIPFNTIISSVSV